MNDAIFCFDVLNAINILYLCAFFEDFEIMMAMMTLVAALFFAIILAIVPHLIWLLVMIVGRLCGFHVGYAPFGWVALALVLCCWLLMAYGYFIGRWRLDVTEMEFAHRDVPASFEGYRIVHISDLHLSTFDDNKHKLSKIVDEINKLHPDLVCFTGDLVTLNVGEALPYADDLRRIRATDGVVSVLGNHDLFIYSHEKQTKDSRDEEIEALTRFERKTLGWRLLRNEHFVVKRGDEVMTVIGVDNVHGAGQGFNTVNCGDLSQAMSGVEGFSVLLSHDPSHWMAEVVGKTNIPLTLSGHTHAAQLRIMGWNPASLMFQQSDGRYDVGDQTIYVNIGLGCTAPIRLGAQPEITLITLKQE